jgi:TRAP-type C4-dicarboxylate transport system substrate-binding protein
MAGALGAMAVLASVPAHADEWRIATLAPEGSVWMKILSRGAKEVEEAGVQGDEKDAVSKLQLGQLDGAALTSVGLSLIDPSIRVLELPRLFQTEAEVDHVRNKMWGTFKKRFEKEGYVLGDPGDVGFIYFYSNKPVKSMADLNSTKMWQWSEDKIGKAVFDKLGISGKSMGLPDVMPALNTGRIDAVYSSPVAMVSLQWYTKVKYSTSISLSYAIGASVIRKEAWNKLSDADKKAVEKVFKVQGKKIRAAVRKDNKRAASSMKRSVTEVEVPKDFADQLDKTAQAVWTEQAGKIYPKDYLDKVLKARDEFRAK